MADLTTQASLCERRVLAYLGERVFAKVAADVRSRFQAEPSRAVAWQSVLVLWYTSEAGTEFLRRLRLLQTDPDGAAVRSWPSPVHLLECFVEAALGLPTYSGPDLTRVIRVDAATLGEIHSAYRAGSQHLLPYPWSCSASDRFRHDGNVHFRIHHRTGRNVGRFSYFPEEEEVVLLPGTRLRVQTVFRISEDRLEIELVETGSIRGGSGLMI